MKKLVLSSLLLSLSFHGTQLIAGGCLSKITQKNPYNGDLSQPDLNKLPDETILNIFSQLSINDIYNTSLACSRFANIMYTLSQQYTPEEKSKIQQERVNQRKQNSIYYKILNWIEKHQGDGSSDPRGIVYA